jgi:pantothenate synthetase
MGTAEHDDERDGDQVTRDWLGARCEELLGKVTRALIDDSAVNVAVSRAFEARNKATQAQESAMGFLNIPTAADLERLTRRLRAVSQRLDAIEDAVARIEDSIREQAAPASHRIDSIESELATAMRMLTELHDAHAVAVPSVSQDQKRLPVDDARRPSKSGKGKGKRRKRND